MGARLCRLQRWHSPTGRADTLLARRQLPLARTPHEQTALQRQIEATDRQIDALVYELYGLTEEVIGIVEGLRAGAPTSEKCKL